MPGILIFHHHPCPILVLPSERTFALKPRDVDSLAFEIKASVRTSDNQFYQFLQYFILKRLGLCIRADPRHF